MVDSRKAKTRPLLPGVGTSLRRRTIKGDFGVDRDIRIFILECEDSVFGQQNGSQENVDRKERGK